MASSVIFALSTGIGLMTDKYMLEATNFVEHYAVQMKPNHEQKEFVKSAMYAGAILGMITLGPISDVFGRRKCLIACSAITLAGALLSMFAWNINVLIAARILTGLGMGGEYPLASSHSAESAKNSSNGSRNVGLLYLFGSGGGPILCDLVCYLLDVMGLAPNLIWRGIFAVGSLMSFIGLVLRVFTTKDSDKFKVARKKQASGATRKFISSYWQPLLGTALNWFLFDIVEYGLKQNDAAIFAKVVSPYRNSVLTVLATRCLVIPSLMFAPWLLTKVSSKRVQLIGFIGCLLANLALAAGYRQLKEMVLLFDALYILQLSFQSLPGVTTMAISAEVFPSAMRGTGAGISAASGKVGATLGSFFFTLLKEEGHINAIFWAVTCTSALALILTLVLTPHYNGHTLDKAESFAVDGELRAAKKALYSGPQEAAPEPSDSKMEEGSSNGSTRAPETESELMI